MSARTILFFASIFCMAICFFACTDDKKAPPLPSLVGRWELAQGFRAKKPTELLTGIYFQFGADGMMMTNLPIVDETSVPYEIKKSDILQKSEPPLFYHDTNATDSTLSLALEMRGVQFDLKLRRAATVVDSIPPGTASDTLK